MNDEELGIEVAFEEVDAPMGAQWFDEAVRRLNMLTDAYARREVRRVRLEKAALAPIEAWFRAEAEPIATRVVELQDAIRARMVDFVAATEVKSLKGPYGTVSTRTTEHWTWPKDDTALMLALAMIDRSTFIRSRTVEEIDRVAVKNAAVVKDGAVLIDGEALPEVTVEERTTVTVGLARTPITPEEF